MSRTSTGKPEFRLQFGYPYITIHSPGAPPREIALDRGDPIAALRGVALEIARAGGRLTAILPEAEVWRDPAAGRGARARAAADLGVRPAALALAVGRAADGAPAMAAVRCETLADARGFLARAGLKPARIIAESDLGGFDAAPGFREPVHRGHHVVGGSALAASLALLIWLAPWTPETPVRVADAPSPAPTLAATPAPEIELVHADPAPHARPANLAPRQVEAPAKAPAAAPILVTMAARNLPADMAGLPSSLAPSLVVPPPAPRPGATPALVGDVPGAATGPLPRPPAARPRTAALSEGGPRPRPQRAVASVEAVVATLGSAIGAAEAATGPAAAVLAADVGPRARPSAWREPVRVASLDPGPSAIASFAPAAPRGQLPAARITTAQPRPKVAAPRPQAVAPRPVSAQPAQAQPVRVRPAAPPVVRVEPAPAKVRRSQPAAAPARAAQPVSRTAAVAQPVRSQLSARAQRQLPAAARERASRRDALALVGIFGTAKGRHALVQLPNGATERVRAGDDLRGVQVTSIAADAVHLRARGRDSVLRLPD